MADRRITYSKEHEPFVENLLDSSSENTSTGVFKTKADALAFAASFAASKGRDKRLPLSEKRAEPIRFDVFSARGYDTLINLLAIYATEDPFVLANSDEMENRRATIFEEFSNCGLAHLKEELKGEVNYEKALLLILKSQRTPQPAAGTVGLDLRGLLEQ